MGEDTPNQRLSVIATQWSLLQQAQGEAEAEARAARSQVLERYGGAVRRYLAGAVRDPEVADELFQDFAIRFLHGRLRGADPQRGRFRDYLKGVLAHLAADWHRERRRRLPSLPLAYPEPVIAYAGPEQDAAFLESWRDQLLARTWEALANTEKPLWTVLRFRTDHPELRSPEMAGRLSAALGRPLTAENVRQLLHRARERFTDLLLQEVRSSLTAPTEEHVYDELAELGLLKYCGRRLRSS